MKSIYGLVFLILFSPFFLMFAEDVARVKADKMHYKEDGQYMEASGNVVFKYADLKLESDVLQYDLQKNMVWAKGQNVEMWQNEKTYQEKWVELDLTKKVTKLEDLRATVKLEKVGKGHLYLKAKEVTDTGDVVNGHDGYLTTCDLTPEHYYLWSDNFIYYKEKRIVGFNNIFYNPIFNIPFYFWIPVYNYDLTRRRMSFLMPLIGKNAVEGWFVRTAWDYFYNEYFYGKLYWDWLEKKGTGLGIKQNYVVNDQYQGFLLYYGVPERDTGRYSRIWQWDQQIDFSDDFSLRHSYKDVDGYLVSGARKERLDKSLSLTYKTNDLKYWGSVVENQNFAQQVKGLTIKYASQKAKKKDWQVKYQKRDYKTKEAAEILVQQYMLLPIDVEMSNKFNYESQTDLSDDTRLTYLMTDTVLKKQLVDIGKLTVNFRYFFDLVNEERTNNFLRKIPEITLSLKKVKYEGFWWQSIVGAGRFQESYLLPGASIGRFFANNRYMSKHNLGWSVDLPFSKLQTKFGYAQYLYETGDQSYTVDQQILYKFFPWQGVRIETDYQKKYADGNSPFFFDSFTKTGLVLEQVQEKLIWTIKGADDRQWYTFDTVWHNSMGYDLLNKQKDDYKTEIQWYFLNLKTKLNLKTGYKFFENRRTATDVFYPLISSLNIKPNSRVNLNFYLKYNINETKLESLSNKIYLLTGNTWEDKWELTAQFRYNPFNQIYSLDSLVAVKDLHCRKLKLVYSNILHEFRVVFSINAFENDTLGLVTNDRESLKLEGVLDDKAENRF